MKGGIAGKVKCFYDKLIEGCDWLGMVAELIVQFF